MSSATTTPSTRIIEQKLASLRRRLTGWLTVHGLGRWLLIVCGLIVADILIDRVFEMDFAQRVIMLVVMAVVAVYFFFTKVVKPLLSRISDDDLLSRVEAKNEKAREQIITSVQLAREGSVTSGTSQQLVDATIESGVATAKEIDFDSTLDRRQHKKDLGLLGGGVLLLAVFALGAVGTQFLGTWFSRNLMLTNRQWPQPTYLVIEGAENGKMILPLGSKHKQIVTITEDSTVTDVAVNMEVEGTSGNSTIYSMKPTGKLDGRERVFEINVSNEFRFRATAANGVTTQWVDVKYVEPPSVVNLNLNVTLPEYTGLEPVSLSGNGPHGVLEGSTLTITANTNKSLSEAKLIAAGTEMDIPVSGDEKNTFEIAVPSKDNDKPISGGDYELKLVDESGLANLRRSKFAITIKEDKPPKLRAELLGISGLVTPRAIIPVSYQAVDDYGLKQMFFDCNWGSDEGETEAATSKQINFEGLPEERPAVSSKDVAVLQLEALSLQPGMIFRLKVGAEDTRPQPPGIGKSQEFPLQVVSEEELRADLLRREIEQRKAFEQIYQAQLELMADLEAVAASVPEPETPEEKFHGLREAKIISMIRDQKRVGTSIDRIANQFEDFLVEVKNNRLDEAENELMPSQRIEKRFDEKIIRPIRWLDQELIAVVTRQMDNCRRLERDQPQLDVSVNEVVALQQQVLEAMKKILDAMNNSETFQEILNEMLEVKRITANIGEGIDKIKDNQTITDDKEAKGIFDE